MSEHKDVRDVERVVSNTNIKIMMRLEDPEETLKIFEQRTQTPNLYQRMQKTLRRFFQ